MKLASLTLLLPAVHASWIIFRTGSGSGAPVINYSREDSSYYVADDDIQNILPISFEFGSYGELMDNSGYWVHVDDDGDLRVNDDINMATKGFSLEDNKLKNDRNPGNWYLCSFGDEGKKKVKISQLIQNG